VHYVDSHHHAICGECVPVSVQVAFLWTHHWENTTCPGCLKHKPVDKPVVHRYVRGTDHSGILMVACGTNIASLYELITAVDDWSRVTCPECLKHKPIDPQRCQSRWQGIDYSCQCNLSYGHSGLHVNDRGEKWEEPTHAKPVDKPEDEKLVEWLAGAMGGKDPEERKLTIRQTISTLREKGMMRTHDELTDRHVLQSRLEEETKIVSQIWIQLGNPTYEELHGRSIFDLVDELKANQGRPVVTKEVKKYLAVMGAQVRDEFAGLWGAAHDSIANANTGNFYTDKELNDIKRDVVVKALAYVPLLPEYLTASVFRRSDKRVGSVFRSAPAL
jgi:hypothetical protein